MEKIVQQGILYDFYGELLTEHQKQVYESVVYENLSLGEIAGDMGVSRQAVHDMIKRTDRILEGYEEKLGLIRRFDEVRSRIDDCIGMAGGSPLGDKEQADLLARLKEIREII